MGCVLISGTPRPAIHATNTPISTAHIILTLKKVVAFGNCVLPETSGLNTPIVSKIIPYCNAYLSTSGKYFTKKVCCSNNNTAAEMVIVPLFPSTPKKIKPTKNNATGFTFITILAPPTIPPFDASPQLLRFQAAFSGSLSLEQPLFWLVPCNN